MIRSFAAAVCLLIPSAHWAIVSPDDVSRPVEVPLNGHTFTLPAGFEIEQVAGPPLVDRPITASFDDQGRLYVTDSSGSNDKIDKQLAEKPHRVVRLEDSDGDGRFDKSIVFADKLMFPEGSLWFDGSLYVSAPPSIWKLTDTDGDGVADRREEWFAGKTVTGCANDLHGPYLGPDGWIYWCKGAFARQTYERVDKTLRVIPELPLNILGKEVPVGGADTAKPPAASSKDGGAAKSAPSATQTWSTRASHIFRCRPDGSGLESVMTGGMDNPVDVVFTPGGERIFTTTFLQQPGGGRRDGLLHDVYGGMYGKDHDPIHEPQHKWTGPDLMPVLSHLGAAAPCGLTTYESSVFGLDYQSNVFACLFNMHKITRHALEPDGATFKSHDSDFVVSSNLDFHPTDILEDADGSLIVVDTGGWYKLCCPTSQLHKPDILGAIYRVRRKDASRISDPRGINIDWVSLPPKELGRLLDDGRPAVRERAIKSLAHSGAQSVSELTEVLRAGRERTQQSVANGSVVHVRGASVLATRNAVWALTRIDHASARIAIRTALSDPDASVRQVAVHAASLWRDREAIARLIKILERDTPQCRRTAAEALGRIGDPAAVPALLAAAAGIEHSQSNTPGSSADRFLEHSVTYALIEIADATGTAAGVANTNPRVRRAALIALDQMDGALLGARQVARLLESPDAPVREAAAWIVSRHADWGDALADYLRNRLAAPQLGGSDRVELKRQLAQFARNSKVQEFLAVAAQDGADQPSGRTSGTGDSQRIALEAMRESGLKELPKTWLAALNCVLSSNGGDLRDAAVAVVRAVPPPKENTAEISAALTRVGNSQDLPSETRLNTFAAVPGGLPAVEPAVFKFLVDSMGPESPVKSRSAAVEVLSKAKLSTTQLDALADSLTTAGPLEVDRLLGAFEQSSEASIGLKLVATLKQAPALSALRPDAIQRSIAKCGPAVQDQAQVLYAAINVDLAKQKERLEDLLQSVTKGGDIRRGQAVFMSTKAACASCHQFGYLGGNIGPDLTRIGGIRNERDLLESIAFPSASFVRSYEPIVVATREGKIISGVLKKDAPDEVVLTINATETARIAREEIDEIRPGTVSVMPSGLDQQLTREELTDLIAFLKAAK